MILKSVEDAATKCCVKAPPDQWIVCSGSSCMAWRATRYYPKGPDGAMETQCYCGLAGKPSGVE